MVEVICYYQRLRLSRNSEECEADSGHGSKDASV